MTASIYHLVTDDGDSCEVCGARLHRKMSFREWMESKASSIYYYSCRADWEGIDGTFDNYRCDSPIVDILSVHEEIKLG